MEQRQIVLVGDIVASRDLGPSERRAVQSQLTAGTVGTLAFRVTAGDEFEWVLPDAPQSLDAALSLRAALATPTQAHPGVLLRLAFGRGEVWVTADDDPYAQDGPAYHRARAAMSGLPRAAAGSRRRATDPFEPGHVGPRYTAFADGHEDPVRDALLAHMDHLMSEWSAAQWEAVKGVLGGATYEALGDHLGVSAQAIAGRLKAARLDLFLLGHAALKARWLPEPTPSPPAGGRP